MGIMDHPSVDFDAIEKETAAIDKNRADWITALRSGKYVQTKGHLYMPHTFEPDTLERKGGYCCIGVAAMELGSNIIGSCVTDGFTANSDRDYELVKTKMDLTQIHFDYLIAMNDGNGAVYRPSKKNLLQSRPIRRTRTPRRDFKFIARWLEIYFALTRMSAPSVTAKDA